MNTMLRNLCAALIAAGLSACGGGGGGDQPPATPPAGGGTPEAGAPAAGGAATPAGPAAGAAATATIKGKTTFKGTHTPDKIQMAADPNCAAVHTEPVLDEQIVAGADGSLENVFVYVKGAPATPAPANPVVIDQNGCIYKPHVLGVVAGQKFEIRNSDKSNHNINVVGPITKFNVNQAPGQKPILRSDFRRPEGPIPVKCNVHPWMNATIWVLPHNVFASTAKGGTFELPKLPAGTYTVVAWHEALGEKTQEVTLADGETKEVAFEFSK